MRLTQYGPGQYREMPWKNGLGSTTELLIDPPGATLAQGFRWRISTAAVNDSGPFSPFPGLDRTLLLLEGGGLELDFGGYGRAVLQGPLQPVPFSGDWSTSSRLLAGPCRDFNVMSDRSQVRHQVEILCPGQDPAPLTWAPTLLLFGARGQAGVETLEGELAAGALLRVESERHESPRIWAKVPATALIVVSFQP